MAKRRLTEQQQSRIQKNQQQSISHSHQSGNTGDRHSGNNLQGAGQQGLVTARYTRHVDVKILAGERINEQLRCHVRANIDSIAVGDRVIWQENSQGEGVVVAVEDRRSLIERPDAMGKLKPIAANIDQMFIVIALAPEPHANLIDRYLIAAENANIEAKLVFNKIDLLDNTDASNVTAMQELLNTYRNLGYEVFSVSCVQQQGLEALTAALSHKASVFVGQSGVGKSSLINMLLPEANTKVGDMSDVVAKGRHTTTTATLYELADKTGYIIDSPGIREFHLNHLDAEAIYLGYRELKDLLGTCRFRDCRHINEPDCAIKEAITKGQMKESRAQSLQFILQTLT